jgi:hypothetical protein
MLIIKIVLTLWLLFGNFEAVCAQNGPTIYKCVLDLNLESISALAFSIFSKKGKIIAFYFTS